MDINLNDPVQVLLGELRYHAEVYDRHRVVFADGTVKEGIALADALAAAARHGGRVDHAELWSLPGGYELLGPWTPIQEES